MITICTSCREQIQVDRSALGRKVRCPICGQAFVAAIPQAEVLDESPGDTTASDTLPIALTPESKDQPSGGPAEADPLAQLADAGLRRARRRRPKSAVRRATSAREADARKALQSLAQSVQQPAEPPWPETSKDKKPTGRAAGKIRAAPTPKRRRVSKDVWYVIAGDYEFGPYAPQEILAAVRAGKIAPGIHLRHALTDSVITAGQILQVLQQPTPPPSAQPPAKQPPRK